MDSTRYNELISQETTTIEFILKISVCISSFVMVGLYSAMIITNKPTILIGITLILAIVLGMISIYISTAINCRLINKLLNEQSKKIQKSE